MAKSKKTKKTKSNKAKILAKKGEVYNLSRDIAALSNKAGILQKQLATLNSEISEMEKKEGK